jgi:hypothetical protein
VARALRDARDEQQKDQRWQRLDAQHPAPIEAGELGQDVVGEECDQDAEDELELVQRDEPATMLRRCDLGDVGGHRNRR